MSTALGADLQSGDFVHRGGDLAEAAGGCPQGGVGEDDADFAGAAAVARGRQGRPAGMSAGSEFSSRLGSLAGVGGGAEAGEDHAAVPGEPLGVHSGHRHASHGQPGAGVRPEPVGGGEQGGEVVVVEVDDACQPRPHRLSDLVAASWPHRSRARCQCSAVPGLRLARAEMSGNVEVGVDRLVAELRADSAGAQGHLGMLRGPLPPAVQPGGDLTGMVSDRGGGGRIERHGVRA